MGLDGLSFRDEKQGLKILVQIPKVYSRGAQILNPGLPKLNSVFYFYSRLCNRSGKQKTGRMFSTCKGGLSMQLILNISWNTQGSSNKGQHIKLGDPGEFKKSNLQMTRKDLEKTPRDDTVTIPGSETRGEELSYQSPKELYWRGLPIPLGRSVANLNLKLSEQFSICLLLDEKTKPTNVNLINFNLKKSYL